MKKPRGVISDINAYNRFKKLIRSLIYFEHEKDEFHTVGKSPWEDDTIVIRGLRRSSVGRYYVMGPVPNSIPGVLRQAGIEHEVRWGGLFGEQSISCIMIPIQQDACPKGRRKKAVVA